MAPSPLAVRDVVVPVPTALVPAFVDTNNTGLYSAVVLATIVLYDSLCTLDLEVKYVWRQGLNIPKAIYIVNRYVGILGAIINMLTYSYNASFFQCEVYLWLPNISYAITIICIDYFLVLRVLALYQRKSSDWQAILLWALLVAEGAAKVGFLLPAIHLSKVAVGVLADNASICGTEVAPPQYLYLAHWSIPLVFGAFLLALALAKATQLWRTHGFRGSRLVFVLITDQILYFFLAILCSVLNILANRYTSSTIAVNILQGLGSPSLQCVLGSRIFFNLKEAGNSPKTSFSEYSSYPLDELSFSDGSTLIERSQPSHEIRVTDTNSGINDTHEH